MPHDDPKIQKLDDESLRLLKEEGQGPCNECICNLIQPPKVPVGLRNKLRNCYDSLQMVKDSTGKLIFRTKNPNLEPDEDESDSSKSGKSKSSKKSKGKKKK